MLAQILSKPEILQMTNIKQPDKSSSRNVKQLLSYDFVAGE